MSLEEAIDTLTAAVKANTAALGAGSKGAAPAAAPKATPPVAGKLTVAEPAAKPVAKPAAKPVAKPAAKPVPADDGEISYDESVKPLILQLGAIPKVGRAAVAEIMSQFGVTKGPELDSSQYEEAIQLLTDKFEELGEQA